VGAVDRHALFATNSLIVVSADNGGPTDGADSNMMNNFPYSLAAGERARSAHHSSPAVGETLYS
jgi:hypothetical protein